MRELHIDQVLASNLLGEPVETVLKTPNGEVVGVFFPTSDPESLRRMIYQHALSLFTDEELNQPVDKQEEGFTLAEIMKELEGT